MGLPMLPKGIPRNYLSYLRVPYGLFKLIKVPIGLPKYYL
jgi:hypothetical protein